MNLTPLSASTLVAVLCQTTAAHASPIDSVNTLGSQPTADQIQINQAPKLMLAKRYKDGVDLQHYWISEKLDGVRAYWDGQQLLSRQGYPISAPRWFTKALPDTPLDGELWMGRGQFDRTSAAVRRYQPLEHEWQQIHYRVFDLPASLAPFKQRIEQLRQLLQQLDAKHIQALEYRQVTSEAELNKLLQQDVAQGAEGLMLNRTDALYQGFRTDALLKLKMYQDDEAVVLAHLPGKGKYQGMLGAIEVQLATGQRLKLGSGFSDLQRQNPPPIGSTVSFKYFGLTETGKPRFASFLRSYTDSYPDSSAYR
ncbi:MAG: DNA ligase [Halopseudomonas sp.]